MATVQFTIDKQVSEKLRLLRKNVGNWTRMVRETSKMAAQHSVQPIFDESQVLVPVDTGALKASGFIEVAKTSRGVQAIVGYGANGSPPYTIIVHENLEFHHMPPTQAKFLEEAYNRHEMEIDARFVDFMRKRLSL